MDTKLYSALTEHSSGRQRVVYKELMVFPPTEQTHSKDARITLACPLVEARTMLLQSMLN